MGRLLRDMKAGRLDQITAKAYLDNNVFPLLDKALNSLLETIERNGELEKYYRSLAVKQIKQGRDLKKRNREIERLKQGDDFNSEEGELTPSELDESSDEDDYGSYDDELNDEPASGFKLEDASLMSPGDRTEVAPDGTSVQESADGSALRKRASKIGEGLSQNRGGAEMSVISGDHHTQFIEEHFNPLRFIALNLKELNEDNKRQRN